MSIAVSFSLFGDDPDDIYIPGFIKNQAMYREFYGPKNVRLYLYLPERLKSILEKTADPQMTSLIPVEGPEDQTATLWRFKTLKEVTADHYLFRDLDSRPIERERLAVAEWIASGKMFHVIRDHRLHGVPMLAGLWSCTRAGAKRVFLPTNKPRDYYGVDQVILMARVWPFARREVYASVDCEHIFGTPVHPIPGDLSEGFCGQDLDGNDRPRNPQNNRGEFQGVRYVHSQEQTCLHS